MYLFLIGLILLQTIIISLKKKNMPLIILGGCAAILIGIFGSLQIRLGIWGVFFVTHILLMLLYSLESQKQFQKESVAYQIVRKYTDIPTYFYTLPLGTLFVALVIYAHYSNFSNNSILYDIQLFGEQYVKKRNRNRLFTN